MDIGVSVFAQSLVSVYYLKRLPALCYLPYYLKRLPALCCLPYYLKRHPALCCLPNYLKRLPALCCLPYYLKRLPALCCLLYYLKRLLALCCLPYYLKTPCSLLFALLSKKTPALCCLPNYVKRYPALCCWPTWWPSAKVSVLKSSRPGINLSFPHEGSFWSSDTSKIWFGTQVATLPASWCGRVSARTGLASVSMLWLCETAVLICSICLGVATCTIVYTDVSLRYANMLLRHQAINKPQ